MENGKSESSSPVGFCDEIAVAKIQSEIILTIRVLSVNYTGDKLTFVVEI